MSRLLAHAAGCRLRVTHLAGSGLSDKTLIAVCVACVCLPAWCMTVDSRLSGLAVGLMAFARYKGVNLSVLGIGIDFLQVGCRPHSPAVGPSRR